MKVYLANNFKNKNETYQKALELKELGFKITSSWLTEDCDPKVNIKDLSDEYLTKTAQMDITDIHSANALVLFTTNKIFPRGGKHWETGYAYGIGKTCITVGPKENIFYFLPTIKNFPTWEAAKEYLLELKRTKYGKKV